jgi:hypothetical protein
MADAQGLGDLARVDPQRLPTLTEVVELVELGEVVEAPAEAAAAGAAANADASPPAAAPGALPDGAIDEAALVAEVIAGLQRRIDLGFEYRLREAIAPALARATEALVRDVRDELARTLRDVVGRAVAQELARRQRSRSGHG